MKYGDFKFKTEDEQEIYTAHWSPESGIKPKAVLQLAHGMAEHIDRYDRFARFLTEHGYIIYGNDHRGHGKTAGVLENVGYFAKEQGLQKVVADMKQLTGIIKEKHPDLPVFLMGHSMGSLLARTYVFSSGELLDGLILSGTMGDPGFLGKLGVMTARFEALLRGQRTQSPLMNNMVFGAYNKAFKPIRTDFDWLSRDEAEVDKYANDPYCGGIFTTGFWIDFLGGINSALNSDSVAKVPKELPVYLFSGDKDPVGNSKKGVEQVYHSYCNAGLKDVSLKFYPDGRHEMLNETNRDEVFEDVLAWLETHLA